MTVYCNGGDTDSICAASVCAGTAFWQLFECMYLAATGARVDCVASFPLRGLRAYDPLVRQYSYLELDLVAGPVPGLQGKYLMAVSGSGDGYGHLVLDMPKYLHRFPV